MSIRNFHGLYHWVTFGWVTWVLVRIIWRGYFICCCSVCSDSRKSLARPSRNNHWTIKVKTYLIFLRYLFSWSPKGTNRKASSYFKEVTVFVNRIPQFYSLFCETLFDDIFIFRFINTFYVLSSFQNILHSNISNT